jgi:hypothetical protein
MNLLEFSLLKKYIIRESVLNKGTKHISLKKFNNWKEFFLFDPLNNYDIEHILGIVSNNDIKNKQLSYMILYLDGNTQYFNVSRFMYNKHALHEYQLKTAQYNSVSKSTKDHINSLKNNTCFLTNETVKNNHSIHYESLNFKNICDLFKKNILKDKDWDIKKINEKYYLEDKQKNEFNKYHEKWLKLNKNIIKKNENHKMSNILKKKIKMLNEFKKKSTLDVLKNNKKKIVFTKKNKILKEIKKFKKYYTNRNLK